MEITVTKDGESHRKRNKNDDEEEDIISLLPDCLLIEIISRLPTTKEAIKTGTLSKRWQYLWPFVSNLSFIGDYPVEKFVSLVDKTLTQCRQSNLNKFKIHTSYDAHFESQVNNWIRYAVNCNVQHLELSLSKFVLDQFIFLNSCFTHLELDECVLNPTGAISWSKLTSLSISEADLSEDLIQNILSGCPLLETLELRYCLGFGRVDITSKSVKNLVVFGYVHSEELGNIEDIIEINAPYIVSLTIADDWWLSDILLVDVSCLVTAHLDYKKQGHYGPTREESHEETLKGLILSLRHVKELKLGTHCAKVLSRLEAKGFFVPWNLKVVDVTSPLSFETASESREADSSDSDSNESGDSQGTMEQVLGTCHGDNHGQGRKLVGVASTTCAQSQKPMYTQTQVDAMFEAQNKMIMTQQNQVDAMFEAQNKMIATQQNQVNAMFEAQNKMIATQQNHVDAMFEAQNKLIATQQNQVHVMVEAQNKMIATQHRMITAQSSQFLTLVSALIKSGFSVPASIVPEHVNAENEEKDGEDENAKENEKDGEDKC